MTRNFCMWSCVVRIFQSVVDVRTWIVFVLTSLLIRGTLGASNVHIREIRVPPVILNGSLPSVILDCNYVLDGVNSTASGLVVKWYHNRSPAPVYQWIPGYPPQAFGLLRGRVNLGHKVSDDPLTAHRAVQIFDPTTMLSGTYTCKVTTWHGVDSASRKMIIYSPVRQMVLVSDRTSRHSVKLVCEAHGMFPEPTVELFASSSKHDRRALRGLHVQKSLKDGSYSVRAQVVEEDKHLPPQATVECVITLPDTDYRRSRKIMYFHGTAPQSLASVLHNSNAVTRLVRLKITLLLTCLTSICSYLRLPT